MSIKSILRAANQWFSDTPERALDQAYRAALMIKAIEDEHFNGKKISASSSDYTDSVLSYFDTELKKYLNIIKVRLAEFKSSRLVFNGSEEKSLNNTRLDAINNPAEFYPIELNEKQSIIIEKLNFIDEIVSRYSEKENRIQSVSLVPFSQNSDQPIIKSDREQVITNQSNGQPKSLQKNVVSRKGVITNVETVSDKTGVLPRSILRTFNRIQRELDPQAEEEVVKNFRNSKLKTIISLKFILTLIIVPILTHQIAKTFVVGPLVERYASHPHPGEFLNIELEEKVFEELHRYEEKLHFQSLMMATPRISPEEIEEKVRERALELNEEYQYQGVDAIKNVFSDILSLFAFALVIFTSRKDILILKSFIDDIVYGLSDSAKAFIIILFTDMFVGFHSPHGWEVILEAVAYHFGVPASRTFIYLFIATFPVILDSVIKYWIFRYLNRVSPSAVATYRNMNE